MQKFRYIILCILFIQFSSELFAQTLQKTLKDVIETHPQIQERLQNYKTYQKDIVITQAEYYPKLDLSVSGGREHYTINNNKDEYNIYENSLRYTQNLFNGLGTTYRLKEQELRQTAAAYSYIEKVNNISLTLANAYLDVLKNEELLGTAKENVAIDKKILVKVKKLYKFGLTTLSEVNKIESSLALAESNLVVQENALLNAQYNLEKLVGKTLQAQELSKPTDLVIALPKTKEEAFEFALTHNPSLLISQYNLNLAKAIKKENKSLFYPKVDIDISQSLNNNSSATERGYDRFRAMAYFSYNLFNGFSDKATVEKNEIQIFQEVQNMQNIKREIKKNLDLAWASNKKLQEQRIYLSQYKEFSKKTLKLYAKEYDLGRRSLLDLLSSQNDFIRAKAELISNEYAILSAKFQILDAMSLLPKTIMHPQENQRIYDEVNLASHKREK
jgi:adhesin transport system outer membrane protein